MDPGLTSRVWCAGDQSALFWRACGDLGQLRWGESDYGTFLYFFALSFCFFPNGCFMERYGEIWRDMESWITFYFEADSWLHWRRGRGHWYWPCTCDIPCQVGRVIWSPKKSSSRSNFEYLWGSIVSVCGRDGSKAKTELLVGLSIHTKSYLRV